MAAMCAGVEPQQPPTRSTPSSASRAACTAMSPGVASYSKWSPTTCGRPAFDCAIRSRPAGRACSHLRRDDLHLAGTTTAVGAHSVGTRCGQVHHGVGRADAHHGAHVGVEAHRHRDRKVGCDLSRRSECRVGLTEVAQRLDEHQVDPALDQRSELLGEERLRLLERHGPERRQQLARRAEVAGDEQPALVCHRSRDRAGVPVDLGQAVAEPVHVQPRPGAAEGVGRQQPRPRIGVRHVRRADRVGVLEVPELTGCTVLEAAVLEQRAHGAVEQHRTVRAQQRREPVHWPSPSR